MMTDRSPSDNIEYMLPNESNFPLRVFFGHHKCATGWIDNILMEVCFHMGIHFHMAHTPNHFEPYGGLNELVRRLKIDFLAYTNADADYLKDFKFYRGFHVVRDPRDILVSAYYSHLHSHSTKNWPELEIHRMKLSKASKEDGLMLEMEFSRPEFEELNKWNYNQDRVMEIKMEELTAFPLDMFLRITRFLGILDEENKNYFESLSSSLQYKMNRINHKGRRYMPGNLPMFPVPRRQCHVITPDLLDKIINLKSFKRMSGGRKKGEENVKNHFRKGVPGDWRNHFNTAHIDAFKKKFNSVLLRLGYEDREDWN